LVTSYVATAYYNTLLKKGYKGREDKEEDISSYWIAVNKWEGAGTLKRENYTCIALSEELPLKEGMPWSQEILYNK
jgi:hypothetical protein